MIKVLFHEFILNISEISPSAKTNTRLTNVKNVTREEKSPGRKESF